MARDLIIQSYTAFQSPSYRGCLCIADEIVGEYYDEAQEFQSPSYRGCLCIREVDEAYQAMTPGFQSPSYRGCLCIRELAEELQDFLMPFQSPSYRGCLCICASAISGTRARTAVSIPFLSGLSLHQKMSLPSWPERR